MASTPRDAIIDRASATITASLIGEAPRAIVRSFFDEATFTASHVVHDPESRIAAIIDSVLDFDPASARTGHMSADVIIDYVRAEGLTVEWLLETHAHADHFSAAPYLQEKLGGRIAIGRSITTVQQVFGTLFNETTSFDRDGSQFGQLFDDGDRFSIGGLEAIVLHVPGHTPADLADRKSVV